MVDPGSGRWWWSGPEVGTMRRRGMGRRPARLIYAGSTAGRRFARKVARASVVLARGWWHSRAGDRSCSGGAQLGTPGTCWCWVAPKDLSDRGALAEDLAPDSRGHIGATLGPQTIRSERTTPDTNRSESFQHTDQIWPSAPGRQRGVAAARSAAWPQRARCPRLHMSQPPSGLGAGGPGRSDPHHRWPSRQCAGCRRRRQPLKPSRAPTRPRR
jgi:hypothetical protein